MLAKCYSNLIWMLNNENNKYVQMFFLCWTNNKNFLLRHLDAVIRRNINSIVFWWQNRGVKILYQNKQQNETQKLLAEEVCHAKH